MARYQGFARFVFPLVCAAVVAGSAPAHAQQEPSALQKILGGIGLLELPKDPIEYRERPPLVVPPSSALIPPQNPNDIANRNPDWPVDHDARRNAPLTPAQKAAARKADDDFYSGRALMPNQLGGGAPRQARGPAPESVEESQRVLSPTQLGFRGWNVKNKDEVVVFTGEPERRMLTDPPPGLLTPSAEAPYGVVTSSPAQTKASTLYDRVSGQADTGR